MGRPNNTQREQYRLPTWHAGSERWRLRITHWHGTKDVYFDVDKRTPDVPPNVIALAVQVQKHWRDVQSRWDEIQLGMELLDPSKVWMKPVYLTPEQVRESEARVSANIEQYHKQRDTGTAYNAAALGLDGLINILSQTGAFDSHAPRELIEADRVRLLNLLRPAAKLAVSSTVRKAMAEYLAEDKGRTSLKTDASIQSDSHRSTRSNLLGVFGLSTNVVRQVPVDLDGELSEALAPAKLTALGHYWHGMPEGIGSTRTLRNYFATLRAFLRWCEERYNFNFPQSVAKLLTASNVQTDAEPFDPERLKRILAKAKTRGGDRLLMYVLFALMLGYYQSDVAKIANVTYFMAAGESYIHRKRTKEQKSKRGSRVIAVKHWVSPELAAMIDAERGLNAKGFLFNGERGEPLTPGAVTKTWQRAVEDADDTLCFKQLRKMGFNRIKHHADELAKARGGEGVGLTVADLWDGHAKGVTGSYDDGIFAPVIAAQKAFADELRSLGILPTLERPAIVTGETVAA